MGAILVVPEPGASADSTTAMTLVRLDPDVHSAAKCLDGSTAGYYHRPGKPESAGGWVVYLEEGGWCFTLEECRGLQHGQQGSSVWWPDIRHDSGGLLSASGIDDPDMSTWHKVLVPSCDATSFASNRSSPVPIPPPSGQGKGGQIWLRGAEIIMAIVVDIQERYGFSGRVLFAGSGSGGLAVLLHLDAIATKIKNSSAVVSDVVGLADSAFIPAMLAGKVTHAVALFKDAVELWHPQQESSRMRETCTMHSALWTAEKRRRAANGRNSSRRQKCARRRGNDFPNLRWCSNCQPSPLPHPARADARLHILHLAVQLLLLRAHLRSNPCQSHPFRRCDSPNARVRQRQRHGFRMHWNHGSSDFLACTVLCCAPPRRTHWRFRTGCPPLFCHLFPSLSWHKA